MASRNSLSFNQKLTIGLMIAALIVSMVVGFQPELKHLLYNRVNLKLVIQDKGVPLGGVIVILENLDTHVVDTFKTDNQGRAYFLNLKPDEYRYYFRFNNKYYKYDDSILGNEDDIVDTHDIGLILQTQLVELNSLKKNDSDRKVNSILKEKDAGVNSLATINKEVISKVRSDQASKKKDFFNKGITKKGKVSKKFSIAKRQNDGDYYKNILKNLPDTFKSYTYYSNESDLSISEFPEVDEPEVYMDTLADDYASYNFNSGVVLFFTDCKNCGWKIYSSKYKSGGGVTISSRYFLGTDKRYFFWDSVIANRKTPFVIFDRTGKYFKYDLYVKPRTTLRVLIKKAPHSEHP